jgi:hypothetical protein
MFGRRQELGTIGRSALISEATSEGFDERVVGGLAGPAEVERDAVDVGPQIEIARNRFRSLVDANGFRIAGPGADLLQRLDDVLRAVAEA